MQCRNPRRNSLLKIASPHWLQHLTASCVELQRNSARKANCWTLPRRGGDTRFTVFVQHGGATNDNETFFVDSPMTKWLLLPLFSTIASAQIMVTVSPSTATVPIPTYLQSMAGTRQFTASVMG